MKTVLAKTAGFCFGVNRAVDMVYAMLDEGKKVCTLGPLIHNPQVIADLEKRGAKIIEDPAEADADEIVVVRTHGVSAEVEKKITETHGSYCDATCPFVKKIHKIVSEKPGENSVVLVAGDSSHPEVRAIAGHCKCECIVFSDRNELDVLSKKRPELQKKDIIAVAQTTFSVSEWEICKIFLRKLYTNAIIFDTICSATHQRQQEACELSKNSDMMIVIGGSHSSNTAKLKSVCQVNCPTYLIESAEQLCQIDFTGCNTVGVTAGASTPAGIIKEVLQAMMENQKDEIVQSEAETEKEQVLNTAQNTAGQESAAAGDAVNEEAPKKSFDEMTFEEALEESLRSMSTDQKVSGTVVRVTPTEIQVDIGRKQAGFVPLEEYSNDPTADPSKELKEGDVINLIIMKTNDMEGTMMLSKRRYDAIKAWKDLADAKENDEVLEGTVSDVIASKGVLVVYGGTRVFVPASQTDLRKDEPLEQLLKQRVKFKVIEISERGNRKRAVVSIRAVARAARREKEKAFWDNAYEGQVLVGTVKSFTSYGAFVDIGGVDGMIHISELSWQRIKHPSEILSIGDCVEVYIKKLDKEGKKVSLGYNKEGEDPWEILKRDYPVGTVATVKIVNIKSFGAFASIIPGVDGLIHISQLADRRVEKPDDVVKVGDEVEAKIINIDFDKKRVSLSIRALLQPKAEEKESVEAEEPADEAPAEEVAEEIAEAVAEEPAEAVAEEAADAQAEE